MNILAKGILALTVAALTTNVQAQDLKNIWDKTKKAAGGVTKTGTGTKGSLTDGEITAGLKEALKVGTQNASGKLSNVNGFFGNQLIKILMPPEAKKIETTLRAMGMGAQVDKAILSMNRAAEDASGKAVPIFVDAITGITIQDGLSILRGSNDAATQYLKGRTTTSLTTAFRPVIQSSLNKVQATKYWTEIVTIYNKLPTTRQKVNPDLTAYVTERALSGLFLTIADEEAKIRTNPAARVSDILRKVFG
ncbi:DUF4197 domain-containing protein [Nemorincola caseinilytica]|uniref:DUF4197 domain-containing protein n=1 Tax=Nemorincola caseinilytica TaxID=2054315 RepID=A0ABP8NEB3_9BACT